MFIHHQYKSPLSKNSQRLFNDSSRLSIHQQMIERNHKRQQISELFHNFTCLSNTVDVDLTKTHFNLIEYEKEDQKIKYDPQIMNAKLKRLQNQAQINRIDFELQQRNKKKTKSKYHRPLSNPNPFENATYQQNYQSFLKNHQLIDITLNDSQSEEDQKNIQPNPKGISKFNQLKKHSKILQYTIKKILQREQNTIQQQKSTDQRKQKLKNMTNQLKDYGEFADAILAKKSLHSTPKATEINPETIVEDKFKRIMTMKANDRISQKVKMNPRCGRMMNLQNEILIELEEEKKSLSKDNMKKLKSRFIEIVNELNKGGRERKEDQFVLPSIDSMASSIQNSARTAPVSRATSLISKTMDFKTSFGKHRQRQAKSKKR